MTKLLGGTLAVAVESKSQTVELKGTHPDWMNGWVILCMVVFQRPLPWKPGQA